MCRELHAGPEHTVHIGQSPFRSVAPCKGRSLIGSSSLQLKGKHSTRSDTVGAARDGYVSRQGRVGEELHSVHFQAYKKWAPQLSDLISSLAALTSFLFPGTSRHTPPSGLAFFLFSLSGMFLR